MGKTFASIVDRLFNLFGYELYIEINRVPSAEKSLVPPSYIRNQVGPFHEIKYYTAVGNEFVGHFKDLCGLTPDESVLDVGCGCGQMAAPLIKYLADTARYEGFDIVPILVNWSKANISKVYPNFQFQVADILNKDYNPKGKLKASEYKFPYPDESFDFVFLKSVFTHMLPLDMENYLAEVYRVLKKGKRCLISYFLFNEESLALIDSGASTLDFKYAYKDYRAVSEINPENAVGFDEEYVRKLYDRLGFQITKSIEYGSWCGRKKYLSYQDIVVATKKG